MCIALSYTNVRIGFILVRQPCNSQIRAAPPCVRNHEDIAIGCFVEKQAWIDDILFFHHFDLRRWLGQRLGSFSSFLLAKNSCSPAEKVNGRLQSRQRGFYLRIAPWKPFFTIIDQSRTVAKGSPCYRGSMSGESAILGLTTEGGTITRLADSSNQVKSGGFTGGQSGGIG